MAGIIASMLARGVEGAGIGAAKVGKAALDQEYEKERQAILQARELSMANLNNDAADRRQMVGQGYAERLERDIRQPFQAAQNVATRGHTSTLQLTRLEEIARENALNRQVRREGQGIQSRQLKVMEDDSQLNRDIKTIQLKNAQEVEKLRAQHNAEPDPTKRTRILENIRALTEKDANKVLPVPVKNNMGETVSYDLLDIGRREWINVPRPGASGGQGGANRPLLESFFGGFGGKPGVQERPAAAPADTAPAQPPYRPPEGSEAAVALARRSGIINQQMAQRSSGEAEKAAAQVEFNQDQAAMDGAALLAKWGHRMNTLSPGQQAILFKARNPSK